MGDTCDNKAKDKSRMAASRTRAFTISGLENILSEDNNESEMPGKRFIQPSQPPARSMRSTLGDLRNKTRNASVATDQPAKELSKQKKQINQKKAKESKDKENENEPRIVREEKMETCSVEEMTAPQIEDIDKEDGDNPQLVVEYVQDIYKYLRVLEREQSIGSDYLAGQQVILPKMRAVLVDWLVGVHVQFKLLPETLYTSVAIMDRYMQDQTPSVSRQILQLVGVASMLIASKYEEIYAPEVRDFVYITDKSYSERDIIKMELKILESLEFNLGRPLPLHFLRRASKAGGVEAITHTLAKYIMELSLVEYSLVSVPPSLLAAASLALAMRLLEPAVSSLLEVWSPALEHYTMYKLSDLTDTIKKLASVLHAAPTAKLTTIFSKYSSKKYYKITRIPALDDPILSELAEKGLC